MASFPLCSSARPVFVVGSPRSGTSVLTWSLGQHPNILPVEETSWIGRLALDLSASFAIGSARLERSQLSATGIQREEFYAHFGQSVHDLIVGYRERQEEMRDALVQAFPDPVNETFHISRSPSDPKRRWVDGTPEYAFYVYGLLLLFPEARFIHLVRDVSSVVRSLMGFANVAGIQVVESEQAAYDYWFRAVTACMNAEQALGSDRMLRVRYADLAAAPEATVRRCLDFLGEPYAPNCLDPLGTRINSSRVSGTSYVHEAGTNLAFVREAERLSETLLAETDPAYSRDEARMVELAAGFAAHAEMAGGMEAEVERLRRELAVVSRSDLRLKRWMHHELMSDRLPAKPLLRWLRKALVSPSRPDRQVRQWVGQKLRARTSAG